MHCTIAPSPYKGNRTAPYDIGKGQTFFSFSSSKLPSSLFFLFFLPHAGLCVAAGFNGLPFGLLLVMVCGAELFTGNVALLATAVRLFFLGPQTCKAKFGMCQINHATCSTPRQAPACVLL